MWSSGTLIFMMFSAHHCKYWNVNFLSFLWFSFSWTVIVFAFHYCWLSSNSPLALWPFLLIFKYHFYSPGDFTSFIQWPLLNFHLNFFCCPNLFLYGLFLICYSFSSVSLVSSFSSLAFSSSLSVSGISFCIYNSRCFLFCFVFSWP